MSGDIFWALSVYLAIAALGGLVRAKRETIAAGIVGMVLTIMHAAVTSQECAVPFNLANNFAAPTLALLFLVVHFCRDAVFFTQQGAANAEGNT